MRALDTNVVVRFLLDDDRRQGRRAKRLLMRAEVAGEPLLLTNPVLLELIWVLIAVYDFSRDEALDALELLAGMPALCFESYDLLVRLITRGRAGKADLADLLIGLWAAEQSCQTTLTFEKGLPATGLFECL
ncbi:MAG: PIN domain-containing protein [Acidobacteriota bacterium]